MKKISTLLGTLFLGAIAASAAIVPTQDVQFTNEGLQKVRTKMAMNVINAQNVAEAPGTNRFSYTDNNGVVWDLNFSLLADDAWYNYLADNTGKPLQSFEDFPYYMVQCLLRNDQQKRTYILAFLSWPCIGLFQEDEQDNWMEPLTVEQLLQTPYTTFKETGMVGFSEADDAFCFLSSTFVGGCTVDGSLYYTNIDQPSTIQLVAYDSADQNMQLKTAFNFIADPNDPSSKKTSKRINYNGEAEVLGFQHLDYLIDYETVHIFNGGMIDSDSAELFNTEWGPFRQYCISACKKGCQTYLADGAKAYTTEDILQSVTKNEASNYNWVFGPLFSAASSEKPYDTWSMLAPEREYSAEWGWLDITTPIAGSFVPFGYVTDVYPWSEEPNKGGFGVEVVMNAKYEILQEGSTISVGTPEGLVITGDDSYGNTYVGSFTGNITYHPNPENMQETVDLPAVGDNNAVKDLFNEASSVRVNAANGAISVNSEKAANVEIFSVGGAKVAAKSVKGGNTVSFPAAKGIYLVKVGNVVKKVIL